MPEIIAEPAQRAPDYPRNPDKGRNCRTNQRRVSAVLRDALPGSPVRPLLELFQAFLEHRFGANVGGHRSTLVAATDDIGIRR